MLMHYLTINFFPVKSQDLKHRSGSGIKLFWNALQHSCVVCGVSLRCSGLCDLDLKKINISTAGLPERFRSFGWNYPSEHSEPHINSNFSYGTNSINGTYISVCLYSVIFSSGNKGQQMTKMHYILIHFHFWHKKKQTFKIHNPLKCCLIEDICML